MFISGEGKIPHAPRDLGAALATLSKTFTQSHTPLESEALPPPEPGTSEGAAGSAIGRSTHVSLEGKGDPKNVAKRGRVQEKLTQMATFAKKHPFLTVGIVVGIILVILAFPMLAAGLAHVTGLSLFQAKIALTAHLSVSIFYWGLFTVNLARRSAVKDELENRIKEAHIALEAVSIQKEVQTYKSDREMLQKEIGEQEMKWKEIHTLKGEFEQLIERPLFGSLPESSKADAHRILEDLTTQIQEGIPTYHADFPKPPDLDLVLPPPKVEHPENAEKGKRIQHALVKLPCGIASYVKKNPVSSLIMTLGVVVTLIGVPLLCHYFAGAAMAKAFGALSIPAILTFMGYGISLLYEGYNTSYISNLSRQLEDLDTQTSKIQEAAKGIENLRGDQENLNQVKRHVTEENEILKQLQNSGNQYFREAMQQILTGAQTISDYAR